MLFAVLYMNLNFATSYGYGLTTKTGKTSKFSSGDFKRNFWQKTQKIENFEVFAIFVMKRYHQVVAKLKYRTSEKKLETIWLDKMIQISKRFGGYTVWPNKRIQCKVCREFNVV